jgi:hypothetical protein
MPIMLTIDMSRAMEVGGLLLFYVLLLVFTLHALFLAYHWFSFGTDNKTSMLALAVYLIGGSTLFLILAFSLSVL